MTADTTADPDGRAVSSQLEMARLVGVIAALREHCPWTAALTHDSLTTYLLEESYEFMEAIETGRTDDMANELGDILLQVVLHARLAQEDGTFELADVARGLSDKMIRRSPHVFHPDGTLQDSFPATVAEIEETWERVKAEERAANLACGWAGNPSLGPLPRGPRRELASDGSGRGVRFSLLVPPSPLPLLASSKRVPRGAGPTSENPSSLQNSQPGLLAESASPFSGIPKSLPALAMAQKSVERAERAGVNVGQAHGNVGEHVGTEEELGKVLFGVVRVAQQRGLDAERALRMAVRDFQKSGETASNGQ